jgi:iron complex outermembrane recepter protein
MHASRSNRSAHRAPLSVAIAAALALSSIGPAFAQDAPAQAGAGDGQKTTELDAVVVTANKRVENVREVAASISVVGEDQLENLGSNSLSDYAALIPGLQVQDNGTPGLTEVSLRGISALSSSATVATYIDEVPLGSSGLYQAANSFILDLLPYDLSRIEVLRGPQGTLYGAGAVGGLLKYVTRAPDLTEKEVRFGAGLRSVQDGGTDWNVRLGANLPLQEGRSGLRVSYARNGLPGYTDNTIDGREDINEGEQAGARAAYWFDGDGFDVNLSVLRQEIDFDDRAGVALDPTSQEPLDGEFDNRTWQPQPFSKKFTLATMTLDWDLGWADLMSATGWSQTDTLSQIDSTVQFGQVANLLLGLPAPGSSYVRYEFDLDKLSQEVRLTSKGGGAFEWMVGVFYTEEDAMQAQLAWLGQLDGSDLPPPYDAMFSTLALIELPSTYKELAVFANGSWRIGDRFKIDAGIRQASNDQWFSQNVPAGILAPIGESPGESSEDVFTWSLSPQYKLSEQAMVYARVATGYQPGGPNVALPGMPPTVDSSMLDSFELGIKAQSAGGRFQLDASVFKIDWSDIQVAASFNGVGGLVNGGEATSEGLEFATRFRATDALTLGLNGAFTDASVKNDFAPTVIPQQGFDVILNTGLAGDVMPYVPEWAWSATGDYTFTMGKGLSGQVGASFRWVGDRVNGTTERQRITASGDPSTVLQEVVTPPLDIGSYHALDLYARIGRGRWELRAYVNNVTGEGGWSTLEPLDSAVTGQRAHLVGVPIQPRTFGLELDFRF